MPSQFPNDIREDISQIRTELGLVLKHVSIGPKNINAVNYLTRTSPPPIEDFYYEEDACLVNDQLGGLRVNAKGCILNN